MAGRPRKTKEPTSGKNISELVESLAKIGCTNKEIAAVCAVSDDTITRNFADSLEKGRQGGKASLRRMQWMAAQGGNATMLIWLGKNMLGQSDHKWDDYPEDNDLRPRGLTVVLDDGDDDAHVGPN